MITGTSTNRLPPRTSAPLHPHHPGTHFGAPGRRSRRCNNDRRIALYRALGSAGAWVSSPEGGRHATATPSGQQLPKECRPSSDPARCPCRPLGPPATVTPGRLLASPISPLKGQTDWVLSPSATTRRPAPGGVWWLWWLWWLWLLWLLWLF